MGFAVLEQKAAHGAVELVLRSHAGGQKSLLIQGDLLGQLRKFQVFQKLADDLLPDAALCQIGRCAGGQAKRFDVVVFPGSDVCQAQKKIRRDAEVPGDGHEAVAGQLVGLFGQKAAQGAFVDTKLLRQIGLGDVPALAQVADSLPQRTGQPFILHVCILLRMLDVFMIPEPVPPVKFVANLQFCCELAERNCRTAQSGALPDFPPYII